MNKTVELIEELKKISLKLNTLENEYIELYSEYAGNEFDNQNECAVEIENLILMLTHELSSQLSFGIYDLQRLIKYIDFRKKYNTFSDDELSVLIDKNDLKTSERSALNKNEFTIREIKVEWNNIFNNISYKKMKKKLKLTSKKIS